MFRLVDKIQISFQLKKSNYETTAYSLISLKNFITISTTLDSFPDYVKPNLKIHHFIGDEKEK